MKTLRSNDDQARAQELYAIIIERKTLEKREKELKDYFKSCGPDNIKAGGIIILQKECTRRDIDKLAILADHGPRFLDKYFTETTYMKLDVLKDKAVS